MANYYGDNNSNTLVGSSAGDLMFAYGGQDTVYGGGGADIIYGGDGVDFLYGDAGNDTLRGEGGSDRIQGFDGDDTIFGGPSSSVFPADYFGGDGNDALYAEGFAELYGGAGNDFFYSGAEGATAHGHGGLNFFNGGVGNDTFHSSSTQDSFYGEGGDDRLVLNGQIPAYMDGGAGHNWLQGGITFDAGTVIDLGGGTLTIGGTVHNFLGFRSYSGTGAGDETIRGSGASNTITGSSGDNVIFGMSGNDSLNGGAGEDLMVGGFGNDTMNGGLGNDRYIVEDAGDVITGEAAYSAGGGIDTVEASVSWTLSTNVEVLRLTGSADISGHGNAAPESLVGNEGSNTLAGNGGNDLLNGKAGADRIDGGTGADSLVGGAGGDTFVFDAIADSYSGAATRDLINGFAHGADRIDLSAIDANPFLGGDQPFDFIGGAPFTGGGASGAGELRYFTWGGGNFNVVEADWNGDGTADMQIFVNQTNWMTGTDFIL